MAAEHQRSVTLFIDALLAAIQDKSRSVDSLVIDQKAFTGGRSPGGKVNVYAFWLPSGGAPSPSVTRNG